MSNELNPNSQNVTTMMASNSAKGRKLWWRRRDLTTMRRDIFTSFLRFFFMCMHAKTHRSVTIFSTLWDCQIYTWDSRNCGLVFLKLQQRMRHILQGKKTILARCRLHHASSVTFEIDLILLMQTSNISYRIVLHITIRVFI